MARRSFKRMSEAEFTKIKKFIGLGIKPKDITEITGRGSSTQKRVEKAKNFPDYVQITMESNLKYRGKETAEQLPLSKAEPKKEDVVDVLNKIHNTLERLVTAWENKKEYTPASNGLIDKFLNR